MAPVAPIVRQPLAPPASSASSAAASRIALPMPTPSSASSLASPTARKMAAELRRHSFRAAPSSAPLAARPASSALASASSATKVLCAATAAARIQNAFATADSAAKSLASSQHKTKSSTPRDLPILRYRYIARDVRVCIGSAWRLRRFDVKTVHLQTGAVPVLTLFSKGEDAVFRLPVDTTCEPDSGNGLKLKSRSDSGLRLRIRFATAADASIWNRLVHDALAQAKWLAEFEEVQCLSMDPKSRVVVARNNKTKEERVVKVLTNVRVDDGSCEEVLILKKLLRLAHDNAPLAFVREYRVVETEHDVRIVMPKHPGKTLLQLLSERARAHVLSEAEARRVVEQICQTLDVLHRNDVVHCDLKLENLLVTADAKDVSVIDFGGAYDSARPNDQQQPRKMVGTPGYIAPERVLRVDDAPTPAADLFSLGIIMYQMLVGSHPFAGRRHLTIQDSLTLDWTHMQRRLQERNVSPEAQQLVEQLVAADPRKRISLDRVFQHAWISNQAE